MDREEPVRVARTLINRHGIRAEAVAGERILEARLSGNAAELDLWQAVQLAIAEFKRTAPRNAA
ncbi:MAG: hypothetical protein ACREFU_20840 [Acetobacteraceae bacterium]